MKDQPISSLINDLEHEINRMHMLLDIWADRMPTVLSGELRTRLHSLQATLHRLQARLGR